MLLGLLILLSTAAVSFGAGYGTRALISRKKRVEYLRFKPYLPSSRKVTQPPAFLIHPLNRGIRQPDNRAAPTNIVRQRVTLP